MSRNATPQSSTQHDLKHALLAPDRALFAKGLAKGCTSAHLQAIFSAFGTVTDCQIARHRSGRSAGFAIVTFARHEEAVAAMKSVDNLLFMGRRLSVKWFSPERAMEGNQGLDVLNMQTLQSMLHLSQLQPVDLMAQLAAMLDAPRQVPAPNPHVAAWLDNFSLARESPLAPGSELAAQPSPIDVFDLSALSLADLPGPALGAAGPQPGFSTNPATPTSLDASDGAVYVSTVAAPDATGLANSRLSKWCSSAPGSTAAGPNSTAASTADDAASDTASVHASEDSSAANSTHLPRISCGAASSSEGPCSGAAAPLPKADGPLTSGATAPVACPAGPSSLDGPEAFLARMQPTAGAMAAPRPVGMSSDPGSRLSTADCITAPPSVFPGAPALPPLRINAFQHQHQAHLPRTAPAGAPRPAAAGPFGSCGGMSPDAMRLQAALAEQARNTAHLQMADALQKLAAAQNALAALNGGGAGLGMPMGMPAAAALPPHAAAQRMAMPGMVGHPYMAAAAPQMGPAADLNTLLLLQNAAAAGINRPFY
ncbi:hypothetical protein GPECTOR_9g525 [Gonium pectorale]|uniref:RRM domain-containing protein n=1 Tax=Gonium pectorale TaxID=33097 RepID=A0A150GRP0_GONPE|nr:hypothetical protein GPECTOR_9g525 [Gonium pectorale]|eukprot:KXZ52481.1 hypothetical protein GPECTOR_9g525 [Gonium pectorale]